MTLKSALALAVKVLNKTMDVSKLSAEKGNLCPSSLFAFMWELMERLPCQACNVLAPIMKPQPQDLGGLVRLPSRVGDWTTVSCGATAHTAFQVPGFEPECPECQGW